MPRDTYLLYGRCPFEVLFSGAGGGTRTRDLLITNQLLYRLSHTSDFDIISHLF